MGCQGVWRGTGRHIVPEYTYILPCALELSEVVNLACTSELCERSQSCAEVPRYLLVVIEIIACVSRCSELSAEAMYMRYLSRWIEKPRAKHSHQFRTDNSTNSNEKAMGCLILLDRLDSPRTMNDQKMVKKVLWIEQAADHLCRR